VGDLVLLLDLSRHGDVFLSPHIKLAYMP
jgi:hypothetical protein